MFFQARCQGLRTEMLQDTPSIKDVYIAQYRELPILGKSNGQRRTTVPSFPKRENGSILHIVHGQQKEL